LVEFEKAPYPLTFARAAAKSWLEKKARYINFELLLEPDGLGEPYVPMVFLNGTGGGVECPDMLGIQIGADMKKYCDLAYDQLSRAARDDDALSPEDRSIKIAQCKAEILAAERIEESLVWQLLKDGKAVELRGDANPLAILFASDQ
jgi:hypothetical protein